MSIYPRALSKNHTFTHLQLLKKRLRDQAWEPIGPSLAQLYYPDVAPVCQNNLNQPWLVTYFFCCDGSQYPHHSSCLLQQDKYLFNSKLLCILFLCPTVVAPWASEDTVVYRWPLVMSCVYPSLCYENLWLLLVSLSATAFIAVGVPDLPAVVSLPHWASPQGAFCEEC